MLGPTNTGEVKSSGDWARAGTRASLVSWRPLQFLGWRATKKLRLVCLRGGRRRK